MYDGHVSHGPPKVEIRSAEDNTTAIVTANLEVILSSGAIHTPQILQRSGIGPRDLLEKAGVDVILDLPGVGQNFQDHCGVVVSSSRMCSSVGMKPKLKF